MKRKDIENTVMLSVSTTGVASYGTFVKQPPITAGAPARALRLVAGRHSLRGHGLIARRTAAAQRLRSEKAPSLRRSASAGSLAVAPPLTPTLHSPPGPPQRLRCYAWPSWFRPLRLARHASASTPSAAPDARDTSAVSVRPPVPGVINHNAILRLDLCVTPGVYRNL